MENTLKLKLEDIKKLSLDNFAEGRKFLEFLKMIRRSYFSHFLNPDSPQVEPGLKVEVNLLFS